MEEPRDEVEVTKEGVKVKGRDVNIIVLVLIAIGVGVLIYMTYAHAQDARFTSATFVEAIKEQTAAIKESTAAQRQANCIAIFKDAGNCSLIR